MLLITFKISRTERYIQFYYILTHNEQFASYYMQRLCHIMLYILFKNCMIYIC